MAEWQMGESEDGETSIGSGSGNGNGNGVGGSNGVSSNGVGGSGSGAGLPAQRPTPGHDAIDTQSKRGYERNCGGDATTAVGCKNNAGGHTTTNSNDGYACGTNGGGGGGYPLRHGQMRSERIDGACRGAPVAGFGGDRPTSRGGVITAGGNTTRGEHLPPLAPVPVAPIPRLGAFPAQRRVHGAAGGGCGGRRVEVRTVAFAIPPVQTSRPPSSSEGGAGGAAVDKEPLPLPPPPAAAAVAGAAIEQQQRQQPKVVKRAVGGGGVAAPPGVDGKTEGDTGADGTKSLIAFGVVGNGVTAKGGLTKPDQAAAVAAAVAAEGAGTAEVTKTAAAGGCGLTLCGAASAAGVGEDEGAVVVATEPGDSPKSLGQHMLGSCGPVIALPTQVVVRQWRRLFLP